MIGAAIGFLLTGAIAFLVEYLDDTLKTPEDVVRLLRLPVIGMIGEMPSQKGDKLGVYVAEFPRSRSPNHSAACVPTWISRRWISL